MNTQFERSVRAVHLMALGLLLVLGWACAPVHATALDDWRGAVKRVRVLAENDAPRAYAEANQLQSTLPPDATAADTVRVWNLLARIELYLADTATAKARAQRAFELAKRSGDAAGQVEADLNLVWSAVRDGKIDQLISVTNDAVAVVAKVDRPDLLGEALLRSSMLYRRLGQLDEAVEVAMHAMEIARRGKDPLVLAYAHQGLGIAYNHTDNHERARAHYQAMREQARAVPSRRLEADAINSLGGVATGMGDLVGGEKLVREAIALYRDAGSASFLNLGVFGLASNLRQQKRYAEAMPLFERVALAYEKDPSPIGLWFALNGCSANYESLGQRAKAVAAASRAYRLTATIGLLNYRAESAQRMATLEAAAGHHRRAFAYAQEALELNAKAGRQRVSQQMLELARRYESESKQREIARLTASNAQQGLVLQQNALQRRWLLTVLGFSLAACAGTVWFLARQRRARRMLEALNRRLQRSQSDLQGQTRILQSVLDSMADGVMVTDPGGQLLLLNPAGARMVGAAGQGLHDQRAAAELSPLSRALRGESSDGVELLVFDPQCGGRRWLNVNARPLADKDGAIHGGVAVFSDVTAHKDALEEIRQLNTSLEQRVQASTAELRQQTRYLRTLIDALPQWIWLKDTNGIYLAVNQATARAAGLRERDMVGKSDLELYPRAKAEAFGAEDAQVLARRERMTHEAEVSDHDGTRYWAETEISPVLDEDQAVLGTVGVVRNITAQKATEAAREAALAEATRLMRMRSDFMAQMSHELRTPLNGILGYAQILRDDSTLGERQQGWLAVIQHSGEHLLLLINDLLDVAKMEAGKLELNPGGLVLGPFLRRIADIVRVRADCKGVDCSVDIAPDLPALVMVDGQRLRQVLLNLLSNAVKFTEHGQVRLRVERGPGTSLRFEVQDSGIGIGADQLEQIFQPFEQAGTARQRLHGAGLGLSISRQLVRLMGSEIHVASRLDTGSTFWFTLELPALAGAVPESPASALASPAPSVTPAPPGEILRLPPEQEMEVLHQLARRGNMQDILQRAAYLDRLNAGYGPLAERLRRLATGYQSKSILALIEQHMQGTKS